MTRSPQKQGEDGEGLAALRRAYSAIVDEARAQVAAGREPALEMLEKRLRAATRRARSAGGLPGEAELDRAEGGALRQLRQVATVHRARALLVRDLSPAPVAAVRSTRPLRAALRTRPTITGNLDVRRETGDGPFKLTWDGAPAVAAWEVRFSERPDPRGDYVVRETLSLPPAETAVEVPLGDHPFRVNVVGRSRDGRPLRRALISSLTRAAWNERWERRATAS